MKQKYTCRMMMRRLASAAFLTVMTMPLFAQRDVRTLNDSWKLLELAIFYLKDSFGGSHIEFIV